jgi:hypothetical protein
MDESQMRLWLEVLTPVTMTMAVFWFATLIPFYTALQPRRLPSSSEIQYTYTQLYLEDGVSSPEIHGFQNNV